MAIHSMAIIWSIALVLTAFASAAVQSTAESMGFCSAWVARDKNKFLDEYLATKVVDEALQRDCWNDGEHGMGDAQVASLEQKRYTILSKLAEGHEGVVYAAYDQEAQELVAIKKVRYLFEYHNHNAVQLWREVQMMRLVQGSDDHMRLQRMLFPKKRTQFTCAYLVLGMLSEGIAHGGNRAAEVLVPSGQEKLRKLNFQLLRGMHYMHTAGLVHNDMRHFNTMLDDNCDLKIIDLGLSDMAEDVPSKATTDSLTMPVFVDLNQYRRDIWMLGSYMLITMGGSEIYHLAIKPMEKQAYKIIKVLGYPDDEVLKLYHEDARRAFEIAAKAIAKEKETYVPLPERFPGVDPELFNLIGEMMRLDRQVPSTGELLEHKYFDGMDRSTIKAGPSKKFTKEFLKDLPHVGNSESGARAYVLSVIQGTQEMTAERAQLRRHFL